MGTTCWSSPNCWSNLPRDILVQVILQLVSEDVKSVRAICTVWRNVCDALSWRRVRGCLRNPQLGSLPLFVHKPLRNIRVELTFNGCQNSVRIFSSSEEDVMALHAALAKLQLHVTETKHNDDLYSTRANKSAGSRTLALYFGNYAVHASIISAILSRLGVLQVWQDLELYAHALPTTWPGQCDRVGLILDGALGSHLVGAGKVLALAQPSSKSSYLSSSSSSNSALDTLPAFALINPVILPPVSSAPSSSDRNYPRLVACSIPLQHDRLALRLVMNEQSMPLSAFEPLPLSQLLNTINTSCSVIGVDPHTSAGLLEQLQGLTTVLFEGSDLRDGIGQRAGGMLRAGCELISSLPTSIQEVQFVGMELPRVYYSSGHFKPWDAVLKRDTVSYLHNEMVSKLSKNLPNLRIVKFLELRVPFDDVPRQVTSHHLREYVTVNANTAYEPSLIINPMTDPSLSLGRVSEKDHVPRKPIWDWEVSVSSSRRLSVVAQDGLLIDGCDVIFNALSVV